MLLSTLTASAISAIEEKTKSVSGRVCTSAVAPQLPPFEMPARFKHDIIYFVTRQGELVICFSLFGTKAGLG